MDRGPDQGESSIPSHPTRARQLRRVHSYTTSYTLDGGAIEIGPAAVTKKACASPDGVMEQEAAYLAALASATHFRLDGGSLALLAADGTYVASYVPAGTAP